MTHVNSAEVCSARPWYSGPTELFAKITWVRSQVSMRELHSAAALLALARLAVAFGEGRQMQQRLVPLVHHLGTPGPTGSRSHGQSDGAVSEPDGGLCVQSSDGQQVAAL